MTDLRFTEKDWERIERDTMAWWNGELQRPLVFLSGFELTTRLVEQAASDRKRFGYMSNYPFDMPADEVVDLHDPFIEASRFYGDSFPYIWLNFGPGIMAGFLGAQVNSVIEPSETVWFSPPMMQPIQEIQFNYDASNQWWKRVKELTSAFVNRYEGMVAVGHTDLGGNLDILASFCDTQKLLMDVLDQPDEVDRLRKRITNLWLQYYDEQDALIRPKCRGTTCWTPIWSTGKTYMFQSDFSYMISPAMFERFVAPDLTECCEHLDHGFYHLDGKGEIPHLDLLLSIPKLRGVQWIPGDGQPPPDEWLWLLKRIRDGGKLCQVFVSAEGARTIVKNLGGRGFLFVILAGLEFAEAETAQAFLKILQQEDISLSK